MLTDTMVVFLYFRPRLYFLIFVVFLTVALLTTTPSILGCTMMQAATAVGYVDYCPDESLAEGVKV